VDRLTRKSKEIESQLSPEQILAVPQLDASHGIASLYHSFISTSTTELEQSTTFPLMERANALRLYQTLRENLAYVFFIVPPQYLIDELIPAFYTRDRVHAQTYGPHDLAVLLILFGIGALLDIGLPPYHDESQHYYMLAVSVVNPQSVGINPSIVTVKYLHLMNIFHELSGHELCSEDSFLELACKVAVQV
jgi:hypothetical protein